MRRRFQRRLQLSLHSNVGIIVVLSSWVVNLVVIVIFVVRSTLQRWLRRRFQRRLQLSLDLSVGIIVVLSSSVVNLVVIVIFAVGNRLQRWLRGWRWLRGRLRSGRRRWLVTLAVIVVSGVFVF